jgi:adenine phosphoribosyltransferase
VESRGFFFGMLIAQELNVGFVPVRKPNKLPYDIISASYELEYDRYTRNTH